MQRFCILLVCFLMSGLALAETAIFAGGCFWCVQADFDKVPGVTATVAGYTGGFLEKPSYEQVSSGTTGHYEAVQVVYEPSKITYSELLDFFWRHVDPTNSRGQFCDNGKQYTTAIFYHNEQQKQQAEVSKQALIKSAKLARVVTPILAAKDFYPAESYHQNYYKKNPLRYRYYRYSCGRDKRLEQVWGPAS